MKPQHPFVLLATLLTLASACQRPNSPTTDGLSANADTLPVTATASIPVYRAHVGILDTLGGPYYQFLRDTLVYALQDRYAFIDTSSELHITTDLQAISPQLLHPHVPYAMQFQVYDGLAPSGNNAQVIQLSFTSSGASSLSRADFAERPEYSNWDRTVHQSAFPTCTSTDFSCKAKMLHRDIARLAFL